MRVGEASKLQKELVLAAAGPAFMVPLWDQELILFLLISLLKCRVTILDIRRLTSRMTIGRLRFQGLLPLLRVVVVAAVPP